MTISVVACNGQHQTTTQYSREQYSSTSALQCLISSFFQFLSKLVFKDSEQPGAVPTPVRTAHVQGLIQLFLAALPSNRITLSNSLLLAHPMTHSELFCPQITSRMSIFSFNSQETGTSPTCHVQHTAPLARSLKNYCHIFSSGFFLLTSEAFRLLPLAHDISNCLASPEIFLFFFFFKYLMLFFRFTSLCACTVWTCGWRMSNLETVLFVIQDLFHVLCLQNIFLETEYTGFVKFPTFRHISPENSASALIGMARVQETSHPHPIHTSVLTM